jgi:hypothetical protein
MGKTLDERYEMGDFGRVPNIGTAIPVGDFLSTATEI